MASHWFPSFMALIECYECSREISSLALKCIHCGAPIIHDDDELGIRDVELTDRQEEQLEDIELDSDDMSEIDDDKKLTKNDYPELAHDLKLFNLTYTTFRHHTLHFYKKREGYGSGSS